MLDGIRRILRVLLSPVGELRWRQYPQSRMSLLSIIAAIALVLIILLGLVLKQNGINVDRPAMMVIVVGSFALMFLSSLIDNLRDRFRRSQSKRR